jgi:hypothetical protein
MNNRTEPKLDISEYLGFRNLFDVSGQANLQIVHQTKDTISNMALSANKQREKEILVCVKSESKKRKWQFKGWQSFKIEEPFLLSVSFTAYGKVNKLNARLEFKPKNIDNLNCEISGRDDYFKNGPLYYKVNSFGMLFPDTYAQFEVNDVTEEKISELFDQIDKEAIKLVDTLSDGEKYCQFLRSKFEKLGRLTDGMYLIVLAYLGKYEELLNTVKILKQKESNLMIVEVDLSNPKFNEKSFYDKLIDFVNEKQLIKSNY